MLSGHLYVEYIRWLFDLQVGALSPMEGRARVAWNLRRLRVSAGLSQEQLAVDAEIDRTYVSGIERAFHNPSLDLLERIAHALNVDVLDLLAIPPEGAKPPDPLPSGRRRSS